MKIGLVLNSIDPVTTYMGNLSENGAELLTLLFVYLLEFLSLIPRL